MKSVTQMLRLNAWEARGTVMTERRGVLGKSFFPCIRSLDDIGEIAGAGFGEDESVV
jgi:hypothetical protein